MPDYSNPQALNRYAYVYNNPLKYTDPSGHCGIVGGGSANAAVMSRSCLEALGGAAVAYAVVVAANQFDLEVDLDLNLNRPSSSPPIQVSSTDIFVLEYPDTEGQRPVLLAPEHIMHTPLMDLNPDLEDSNASSGGQGLSIEGTFHTSDATTGGPYRGGRYGRLNAQRRVIERHHLLPQTVSPLSRYSGPSIQMDYQDHRRLMSTLPGWDPRGQIYRARLQNLVDQGRILEAMQLEISEIRRQFGNKYDDAIDEAMGHLPDDWE